MTTKEFKKCYLQWSKAVAYLIPTMLFAVVLCDYYLEFAFSRNMYFAAFLSGCFILSLLSISWISVLNLEGRFMKSFSVRVVDEEKEEIALSDIAECIKRVGYTPDINEDDDSVMFRIHGELYRVNYKDCRFSLYKYYQIGENTNVELLRKAIVSTEENVFGMKVFITSHEDGNSIIFQFASLFKSVKELNSHFPRCLSILNHGITFHRERYAELEDQNQSAGKELVGEIQVENKVLS